MTTIEIVSEDRTEQTIYRAICGEQEATGATPGQALDRIEQELTARGGEQSGCTVVIVQRFLPDDLFPAQQQARLRELMERLHEAVAIGEALAPQVQQELEELVEAELKATIERSARILKQTQREEK
ncbi:hypothetical protein [Microcoleus sp. FACHB-SPT15]|uniref:hypothetical protein n=1 Tax=Microcoleus sp. FACHB-SPT15 TaxID=2692830 RepID=UPI0018F0238C|nr:hypothetical protein [Microcoleus sp. FACHB-SPT15]